MGRARRARAVLFLVAAAVAACSVGAPARADVEETERRLKTAGVPDQLRVRIHDAIKRGAAFLVKRQRSDGAFAYPGSGVPFAGHMTGTTALAALALAHSGGPDATEAAQKGLEYLTPEDDCARPSAISQTYSAGLTAMLLHALGKRPKTARRIVANMAATIDPANGWWGYGLDGLDARGDALSVVGVGDLVNLSTTQYGALALWAGSRASGVTSVGAWRLHLRGLCAWQQRDGSWSYGPHAGSQGYPNGTFMGLAGLQLARTALSKELEDDPVFAAQAAVALRAGLRALERDVPEKLRSPGIDYYGYYALEKACVFLDVERAGGQRWYIGGAERLLADQLENGGWGGEQSFRAGVGMMTKKVSGDCVSTGFALLFLLRASETFHPTTPHGINALGPITPGSEMPASVDGNEDGSEDGSEDDDARWVVPPPPPAVSLADASAAIDRLDRAARRLDRVDESIEAITVIAGGLRRLEPDPPAAEATPEALLAAETAFLAAEAKWRERAGKELVDAVGARSPRIARAAAAALERGPRSVSDELRTRLDAMLRGGSAAPRSLIEAAYRAVAALGDPRSLAWLATSVTSDRRPSEVRRARAALLALATWEGGTATERRAAALRVARYLDDLEASAAKADPDGAASWTAAEHWRQLGPPAIEALDHLCRDPEAPGGTPPWPGGDAPESVAAFKAWLLAERRK